MSTMESETDPSTETDPADARELTERIREAAETVYELVLQAHDLGVAEALGYQSWEDYAGTELHLAAPETVTVSA